MSDSSFQQVSDEAVFPFNGAETSHQTDPDNQEIHDKMWEWEDSVQEHFSVSNSVDTNSGATGRIPVNIPSNFLVQLPIRAALQTPPSVVHFCNTNL
jgi:hypothetical protein